MTRFQYTFLGLVTAQTAHSFEEYAGHLYEIFPPARLVSGLVSRNLEQGFVILNIALVTFGFWCFLWPIRRQWPSQVALAWTWAVVECSNGIVHPAWSLLEMGYTPGVGTAPVLLILAILLARQLRRGEHLATP
jgi:hypothetical protein